MPGVCTSDASTDPAATDDRNISPALAAASVAPTLVTSVVSTTSPATGVLTKLNWSAAFQMSAPPPETVHDPLVGR